MSSTYVAFVGTRRFSRGPLEEVVPAAKRRFELGVEDRIVVFDEQTGCPVDLNFDHDDEQLLASVRARLEPASPAPVPKTPRGRGRPKLGVVSREVSLLPRHWEWLAKQRGGASASLRRLVEVARKEGRQEEHVSRAIERAHRFLWDMAGDLPGFEDATRALFAREFETFDRRISRWPIGVRELLERMLADARPPGDT